MVGNKNTIKTKRYWLMPEGDGKNPSISLRQETFINPETNSNTKSTLL